MLWLLVFKLNILNILVIDILFLNKFCLLRMILFETLLLIIL